VIVANFAFGSDGRNQRNGTPGKFVAVQIEWKRLLCNEMLCKNNPIPLSEAFNEATDAD
jgi:hypothetical protein